MAIAIGQVSKYQLKYTFTTWFADLDVYLLYLVMVKKNFKACIIFLLLFDYFTHAQS